MQSLEEKIPKKARDRVIFVLVSLQPEIDTPMNMQAFAEKRGLGGWVLLSGSNDDVRTLAMTLDVKYKKAGDDEIAHSNLITILDTQGRIERRVAGVALSPDVLVLN